MTELKVYTWRGVRFGGTAHAPERYFTVEVIAAHSLAEVLRLTGMPRSAYLANDGRLVRTPTWEAVALVEPGVVFWTSVDNPQFQTALWHRVIVDPPVGS